ncbi:monocarboxylate transporter 5-like [Saccostrea echinata]|uniref:monocarboxylate transporter 5-like n=1 Tax=Saccostrea echinata TaxID=191078 RepID=UPI002A834AE6|nr:monocarboxylate transporter 5-like [Saccostrea echinata]
MKNDSDLVSHPVDRGWAWVILAASSLIFMIYVGTIKTSGLFFVAFQEFFHAEASTTSLIPGILQIIYSSASLPILTFGLHHFSVRQMIIVGGFLGSTAYFIGFFADRIEIIVITHGVIYGMGFATLHGPAAYLIGTYFDKRRALANSILVAASGFGGLVLPPLYRYLMDVYGLQGTMLILSGILLNVVALAGLLKPPSLFAPKEKVTIEPRYKIVRIREINRGRRYSPIMTGKKRSISLCEKAPSSKVEHSEGWGSLPHNLNSRAHHSSTLSQSLQSLGSSDAIYSLSQTELEAPSTNREKKQKILDITLLKKPLLQLFLFVYCFGSIGSAYGHIFISPFARDQGFTTNDISLLISITNMCDFLGRLMCGVIANQRLMKNSSLVAISQLVTGATLALCSVYRPFWSFCVLAVMYGLFSGAIFSMTPAIIADFVGMENFRTSFGILILGQGFTLGGGAPLLGYLRDLSQSYTTSFYFMGSLLLVSGVSLLLEPCVRSRQERMESREEKSEEVTLSV